MPRSVGNSQAANRGVSFVSDDEFDGLFDAVGDAARASTNRVPTLLLRIAHNLERA